MLIAALSKVYLATLLAAADLARGSPSSGTYETGSGTLKSCSQNRGRRPAHPQVELLRHREKLRCYDRHLWATPDLDSAGHEISLAGPFARGGKSCEIRLFRSPARSTTVQPV